MVSTRLTLALAMFLGLTLSLDGRPASAQDAPSPLVIEAPEDGERVETPFTVSGRAPAGVQLELWLGNALERVFRADSTGAFSTPVSTPVAEDTKIWVHEIGARGKRIRSAYVVVNWSGEAAPRPELPDDFGLPELARGFTEPANAPASADVEREPTSPPLSDSDALPPVEDLGSLDSAPPPPPVEEAAGVDPFETADQVDPFEVRTGTESIAVPEEQGPGRPPPPRFARGLAETGVGLATAATGGFVGGLVGAGIGFGLGGGDGFAAAILAAIGVVGGWVAGLPIGVLITGKAMQGNGKIWATVLGEVVGFIAAGTMTELYYGSGAFNGIPPILFVTLMPAAGAAIGYELTSDHSRFEADTGLRSARPILRRTADGTGAVFGLSFRF